MQSEFLKIDLHNHTIFSKDAIINFKDLKNAYKQGKFDVIAITDHNTIKGAKEIAETKAFPTIIGEEVSTEKGDVIGLFLKREIQPYLSLKDTVAEIKKQSALVYIPHPFDLLHSGLRKKDVYQILSEIDIFETHNGSLLVKANTTKLIEFAKKHHLIAGAGSDAHVPHALGRCFLKIRKDKLKSPLGPKNLMEALSFAEPVQASSLILTRIFDRLKGRTLRPFIRKNF